MNNQWSTPIDKLMLWRINNWSKCQGKTHKYTLHIHYDQLMITSDSKVLESFNMNSKIKGVYKEDILILIVSVTGQGIRKIKFQIKMDVLQCLEKLNAHFPIVNHSRLPLKTNVLQPKYRSIEDVLKNALENNVAQNSLPLPSNYGNFMKLCLLDPNFPDIVAETEALLQDSLFKKSGK